MPDARTLVTELGTALGMLDLTSWDDLRARRPSALRIGPSTWDHLDEALHEPRMPDELLRAMANGQAFLAASDGLRHRPPALIEWTGGRRPPGDEVAPIDLRVDHVYLISCKYESNILANASPARVFDGLLATSGSWDRRDWYLSVAPIELQVLYRTCRAATGLDLPDSVEECSSEELAALRQALPRGAAFPDEASRAAYGELCRVVSARSAERWRTQLEGGIASAETMLWRLLRIGSAPYFVLGYDRTGGRPARYRIASPWDWRDQFHLLHFSVRPGTAGQPRVDWSCTVKEKASGHIREIAGHVEVRWSHGRFAQPPEAKVYLDTPMTLLPGYHSLDSEDADTELDSGADEVQLGLFDID